MPDAPGSGTSNDQAPQLQAAAQRLAQEVGRFRSFLDGRDSWHRGRPTPSPQVKEGDIAWRGRVVAAVQVMVMAPVLVILALLVKVLYRGPVLHRAHGAGDEARFSLEVFRATDIRRFPGNTWVHEWFGRRFLASSGFESLPMLFSVARGLAPSAVAERQEIALSLLRRKERQETPKERVATLVGCKSSQELHDALVRFERYCLGGAKPDDEVLAIGIRFDALHECATDPSRAEELGLDAATAAAEAAKLRGVMAEIDRDAGFEAEARERVLAQHRHGERGVSGRMVVTKRCGARDRSSRGKAVRVTGSRRVPSRSPDDPDPEPEARKGTYDVAPAVMTRA